MIILALTTSTDHGSVAVMVDGSIKSELRWSKTKLLSEAATLYSKKALKAAGVAPSEITLVAVDHGPGSFTGARMAVNVVRTMAYTLGVPVFSASSLEI